MNRRLGTAAADERRTELTSSNTRANTRANTRWWCAAGHMDKWKRGSRVQRRNLSTRGMLSSHATSMSYFAAGMTALRPALSLHSLLIFIAAYVVRVHAGVRLTRSTTRSHQLHLVDCLERLLGTTHVFGLIWLSVGCPQVLSAVVEKEKKKGKKRKKKEKKVADLFFSFPSLFFMRLYTLNMYNI